MALRMRAHLILDFWQICRAFVVMAAADEAELCHMVATAVEYDAGPIAFRFPRGEGRWLHYARKCSGARNWKR